MLLMFYFGRHGGYYIPIMIQESNPESSGLEPDGMYVKQLKAAYCGATILVTVAIINYTLNSVILGVWIHDNGYFWG